MSPPPLAKTSTRIAFAAALFLTLAVAAPFAARAEDSAPSLVDEARARVRKHDLRGAITLLERAIATNPGNADAHIVYQDVGKDAIGTESLLTTYRQKAADKPDDPVFAYLYARLLTGDAAVSAFDKLILQFAGSPWPHVGKARALENIGKLTEASAEYDAALAASQGDVRFKAYQASGMERAGNYGGAADAWKAVLAAKPNDRAARLGLGEALRKTGSLDDALSVFNDAVKADPSDAEALYRVGITNVDADKLDDGLTAFDKALAIDRTFVDAYCSACEAAIKKGIEVATKDKRDPTEKDFEKAIAYGNKAIAVADDRADAHFAFAAANEAAGEDNATHYDVALSEYDKALNLLPLPSPDKVRALCAKAYVLLRLARWDQAVAAADKAIGIDEKCAAAYSHAGHALAAEGKQDEAIKKYYRPGLRAAPDDARLHHGLGIALLETGKDQDAKKEFEAAVKYEGENPRYRLTLGQMYYDLKMFKQAGDQLVKVVEARPNDSEGWRSYGRVCTKLQDWDQAVESYEKICAILEKAAAAPAPAPAGGAPGGAAAPAPAGPSADDEDILRKSHLYLAIIYNDHKHNRDKARDHIKKFQAMGGTDTNLQSWIDALLKD